MVDKFALMVFAAEPPASEEDGSLLSEITKTKEEAISSAETTFDTSSSQKQFSSMNSNNSATTQCSSDSDKENLRFIDPRFPGTGCFLSFFHKYHYLLLHYLLSVFPFCFTQLVKRKTNAT